MYRHNGLLFSDNGAANLLVDDPPQNAVKHQGWARDAFGYGYIKFAPQPVAYTYQGRTYTRDGALIVTGATPGARNDYADGYGALCRADGALYIGNPSGNRKNQGWLINPNGSAAIDGFGFFLGLGDKGSGEVNLVPEFGTGSATFTRATTATTFGKLNDPYLRLPGLTGNYASTPDSAANSIAGDIDIRAKVAMDDWTPSTQQAFVAKDTTVSSQRSYALIMSGTAGTLQLYLSESGGAPVSALSSAATGVADGGVKWVRATWRQSDGRVQFFLSDDGIIWSQLGTDQTLSVAGINNSTAPVEVGSRAVGSAFNLSGKIYYAEVRNGIDGTPVAVFDALDASQGATSFVSSATGETWAVNQSGTNAAFMFHYALVSVSSGTPRSWYWPDTLAYGGYLAEGARTNLCLQSEDLATTWTNTRSTETVNATVAPDGATTADKIVSDATAANTHFVQQAITFTNVVHTFSVFLKAAEKTWGALNIFDGTTSRTCYFNLSTGEVGTTSGTTGAIKAYPNGWYRCEMTTSVATLAAAGSVQIYIAEADNDPDFDGNSVDGIYAWGAQLEAASFASSYIPTTTASVTRNADVLTYAFAGNADATQGTAYAELGTEWASNSTGAGIVAIGYGTTGTPLFVQNATADTTIASFDSANIVQKTGLGAMSTASRKRACAFGSGQSVTGDGLAVATGTFDGSMGDNAAIGIGCWTNGTRSWFGPIKNVAIYRKQLADAQLQDMT